MGARVKGLRRPEIVVAEGNFHGRTTTIISFSSEPEYRDGFGPFTPGFRAAAFGDLAAMEAAITPDTAAVLVEPIQGEAGIIVPPQGWLAGLRRLCDERGVFCCLTKFNPVWAARALVRVSAREHPARRAHAGQSAGRRRVAGLRFRGAARAYGRIHAGLSWLDLRRQLPRGRGRTRRSM